MTKHFENWVIPLFISNLQQEQFSIHINEVICRIPPLTARLRCDIVIFTFELKLPRSLFNEH